LGGKKASIQYAHETKVVSDVGVERENSLPSWGRPISSRKIIQAANQMDLFELAASIDALSKALESRVQDARPGSQYKRDGDVIQKVSSLRTDEKAAASKENVVVNNVEEIGEAGDNDINKNKAPKDAVVNNILAGEGKGFQKRSGSAAKGLDHQIGQQFRLKDDSELRENRIKREDEKKFRFHG